MQTTLPASLETRPQVVPRAFYNRSPELVARELLGKVLRHTVEEHTLSGRITEVEAYLGLDDPASHAAVGRTARNAVLFGPPGFAYVYFIYGMHFCLNVSCLPEGQPGGVLFRALEPLDGLDLMASLRGVPTGAKPGTLTSGPGRLCQALDITRANANGLDFTSDASPLQILDDGFRATEITTTPRIGIRKAADQPLRFLLTPKETSKQKRARPPYR